MLVRGRSKRGTLPIASADVSEPAQHINRNRLLIVEAQPEPAKQKSMEPTGMKSSIRTFVLRFAATVVLFARDGFARDPNSVSLCPPSLRMTEHDGCQPSNGFKSSLPAPIKKDDPEQWTEIVSLINNTSSEIQYCVWAGPLRSGWTLDAAKAEISRCQQAEEISDLIKSIPSSEVQSCVWTGPLRNNLILDKAKTEIARCQGEIWERERQLQREIWERERQLQRKINIATAELLSKWIAGILAGIVLLALTIRFRRKIAVCLYNLFVRCLALRLRFNRSSKRFLDNAIKEAENRLG